MGTTTNMVVATPPVISKLALPEVLIKAWTTILIGANASTHAIGNLIDIVPTAELSILQTICSLTQFLTDFATFFGNCVFGTFTSPFRIQTLTVVVSRFA